MENMVKMLEMVTTTPLIMFSISFLFCLKRREDVRGISFFIRRRYVQAICVMIIILGTLRFFRILFYGPDVYYSFFFMVFVVLFSFIMIDAIGRLKVKR